MRKIWDFPGGVHPADNKVQSLEMELGTLPLPERFIVPINQHNGPMSNPVVSVGDRVLKGQEIAEAAGYVSVPAHAPTSGTVVDISEQSVPHPSGLPVVCITIEPDGKGEWIDHHGVHDYRSIVPLELLQRVRHAGIAGLGGAGFPSAVKLDPGGSRKIKTLIINATECEPYITADYMLMRTHPAAVVEGIKILAYLLGDPEEILIGIEDNKSEAYEAIEPYLKETNIELVEFPTKYPSGGEKQLIHILTGQEVPSGKLPADIGIICQNVGTTYAIYRAIVHGEPLISRITTVTGEANRIKRNFEVLIGTPINFILEQCGFNPDNCDRVIKGGPMMGFALPHIDVPVIKTTNCILAPTREEMPPAPPAQPCIRCGACAEACPASLLPQQLFWYAQAKDHDRLQAHNLFDCIECGACSYICPSNIPLVQYYRASKGEIRHLAQEKIKSDRARERFEFNKERKVQLEVEKATKREARRKAAEEAKAQLAQKQAGSEQAAERTGTTPEASDVLQAAIARVAAKKATPEQQRAKLERNVSSADNRLARLQQKLQDATESTPEQQEAIKAQIESARLKLEEAREKLDNFSAETSSENNASAIVSSGQAEKLKAKVLASPRQTLEKKIDTLQFRISDIDEKIANCDDDSLKAALQNSLRKFQDKLQDAETELKNNRNPQWH